MAKGNTSDGARGVTTYTGKAPAVRGRFGNETSVLRDDLLHALMQQASAAVVSEPAPKRHDFVRLRGGEIVCRWEARQETLVVRHNGIDAGLLKHDLRDPNRVRVACMAPRKVAGVVVVPLQELVSEAAHGRSLAQVAQESLWMFKRLDDVVRERGADMTVDNTVVERKRKKHDLADFNLACSDDGALLDAMHA